MKKVILSIVMVAFIFNSVPAFAQYEEPAMIADVLVVRPVSLAAIVVGAAFFIVALPFAITSGSVETVAQTLVGEPFRFTFTRPIGDFSQGRAEPSSMQSANSQ